jgi:hypothetical protein
MSNCSRSAGQCSRRYAGNSSTVRPSTPDCLDSGARVSARVRFPASTIRSIGCGAMFAAFYDENGSRTVNGAASGGRAAITATVRAYVAAFPDMVVKLDSLRQETDQTIFIGRTGISRMTSTCVN